MTLLNPMEKIFVFVIAMGWITFLMQEHMVNLSQDNINTSKFTQQVARTYNKTPETFASFIGFPNFYVKYGHRSIAPNDNLLSICSFCSLDILRQAQTLATNYKSGPLSLAVYIDQDIRYHSIASKTTLYYLFDRYFQNISTPYGLTIGILYINKS
eukprot:559967_1